MDCIVSLKLISNFLTLESDLVIDYYLYSNIIEYFRINPEDYGLYSGNALKL